MKSKNNKSAFPLFENTRVNSDYELTDVGMSLQDYFAGQALASFWSTNTDYIDRNIAAVVAEQCYTIADAMLLEREKR